MKFYNKCKIIIATLLIISLSANVLAAIVSDNDGSAFISKSEFDSLSSEFQSKINEYNSAIDAKIDTAIANYLAGIKISTQSMKPIIFPEAAHYGVISIDSKNPLNYCYGFPLMQWDAGETRWRTYTENDRKVYNGSGTTGIAITRQFKPQNKPKSNEKSRFFATKSVITKLVTDDRTKTNSIAQWEGYRKECYDFLKSTTTSFDTRWGTGDDVAKTGLSLTSQDYMTLEYIYLRKNQNIINQDLFAYRDKRISGSTYTSINMSTVGYFTVRSIVHDWGTNVYPYVSVLQNYKYDMFSNKDRDYNFYYDGTYMNKFKPQSITETYTNKVDYKWTAGGGLTTSGNNVGNPFRYIFQNYGAQVKASFYSTSQNKSVAQSGTLTFASNRLWNNGTGAKTMTYYVPMIGFETTYLQSWSQIYLGNTDSIATFEKKRKATASSILTSPANKEDMYLGLTAGFPIIKLSKYESLKFDAKFKDTKKDYVIWVSDEPFSLTGHPDDDKNCLELKGLSKASNTERGYLVPKGNGTFETPKYEREGYVYIKWGIYNATKANIGGGVLMPDETTTVIANAS